MDLPIIYLIVNSFTTARITGTWNGFSFIPYQTLFNYAGNKYAKKIWNAAGNTLLVALVAGGLATIVGTMGAMGTHYMKRKWLKKSFEFVNQIPVINAEIVMAISLCILFVSMHWPRTFITLVIGHMVLAVPFVVLSVEPKLEQMDNSLYEAALDLGATQPQAILKVMIPDILPGIISGFLLSVISYIPLLFIDVFTFLGSIILFRKIRFKDKIFKLYDDTIKEIQRFGDMKWLFETIMEYQSEHLRLTKVNYSFNFKLVNQKDYLNELKR